jgi:ABC-type sugar transport system ATPase subunit
MRVGEWSLQLRGVSAWQQGRPVLRGVHLRWPSGQIHALLGAPGSGKSALLEAVAGELENRTGEITLGKRVLAPGQPAAALKAGVALVHQTPQLVPELSVMENLLLGHLPSRWGWVNLGGTRRWLEMQLEMMGEGLPLDEMAGELDPADGRRLELCRALLREVKVLALDSAFGARPAGEVRALRERLLDWREQGRVVVWVCHDLEDVVKLCDSATVMRQGSVHGHWPGLRSLDPDVAMTQLRAALAGERCWAGGAA